MDIAVKKFIRLLKPDQPAEVRAAAVLVAGELGVKDAEASAELLACMDDDDDAVRLAAVRAAGTLGLKKALPTLLDRIKSGGEESHLAAAAAAKLGPDGVKGLQDILHHVPPGVRRTIAAALTAAGDPRADVAVLLDKEPQIAAAAANAIISRIPTLPADQRESLVEELIRVASDKKRKPPPAAELPLVKVLAALNDPSAADALWDRTLPPHPPEVRAAALQAVGGWTTSLGKDHWRRLFACAADPAFAVAAPALMILHKQPATDKQLADWIALLSAPDIAARRLAMDKIGDTDTPEVAAALMAQLTHPDRALQEAARVRLGKTDHGRQELAKAVLAAATTDEMWPLARSVAQFVADFPPKLRSDLLATAGKYIDADDHRADPLLFLLRHADPGALRDALLEKAVGRRKKKDYEGAVKFLKLAARDPAAGFPVRLELALCGLKLSNKDVAADSRATDPALRSVETALAQQPDEVLNQVEKAKWLDAEDLFYLGFHFAERFGAEKAFGAAVLKLVVKASPKSKLAAAAKNKLKSVAAD
jgi:HEAT repeat protein